jgi:acyl-CoA thioester hydrolase
MSNALPTQLDVPVRVRYSECDPMNVAHHSVFPIWLEIARVELLRSRGVRYRDLEAQGILFVVVKLSIRYRKPAFYDDELIVRVKALSAAGVKYEHEYEILRGTDLIATAETMLACVDRQGKPRAVPPNMI